MKIYTKKGDAGETGLFGNARVPKDDMRIRVYGTFDELNSVLGMVLSAGGPSGGNDENGERDSDLSNRLERIQSELFQLGTELATPHGKSSGMVLITDEAVARLEREIDAMEAVLPPLRNFILPGGVMGSALLHFSRTVCRRGERELTTLHRTEPVRGEVLRYINRLSDYLFVCARFANHRARCVDVPWVAPRS